ncbi:MAG: hypothetical protein H8E41_12800 [Desulfobulbaceae bacterium]|uniref:Uncharacterized protein n=1 Tax=Candidatus Desulfobia pelagia TaxID=2841692 RepID=A0A8J6NFG0_9BACT|nr:hypothetical protein [Candidatus Desulfobia pelagia]
MAYWEHVGVKRQDLGNRGDSATWYIRIEKRNSFFKISTLVLPKQGKEDKASGVRREYMPCNGASVSGKLRDEKIYSLLQFLGAVGGKVFSDSKNDI